MGRELPRSVWEAAEREEEEDVWPGLTALLPLPTSLAQLKAAKRLD